MPAPGNHEYGTTDAAGYFAYFGAVANPPLGYYSFDLGEWHIVSLNSDICGDEPGCGPGTPQGDWLRADLEANAEATCTLAFMHHPRYDWRPFQKWIEDDATTKFGGSETRPLVPLWDAFATKASTSCSSGTTISTSGGLHRTPTASRRRRHGPVHGGNGRATALPLRPPTDAREPRVDPEQGVRRAADDPARGLLRLRMGLRARRARRSEDEGTVACT